MDDSSGLIDDPAALKERMERDGYLYLKNVIPKEKLQKARERVLLDLEDTMKGQTPDGLSGDAGLLKGGQAFVGSSMWHNDPAVSAALECPELFHVFEQLFEEDAATFDFKWIRGMPPGGGTGFHMDNIYMSGGSRRLHTCWIPLMPIDLQVGGLCVLEGSHRASGFQRIRDTYAEYDVDNTDIQGGGNFTEDPVKLRKYDPSTRLGVGPLCVLLVLVFGCCRAVKQR
jgi:ectoine hydroxylase-related dioxygenase (phytanoyl-CoA dioxygenase family)